MGLANYFEHGYRDSLVEPDRVDWVESRNLPTSHPQAAARIMRATARDSTRTRKPVYHLSISFDPSDPVDRATMRQVADRTLRDLGLQEHQALIVAHKDRAHPHLHIMVNRVHPERCTAWSKSWDYARIERSLREQEKEHGLRVVPGRHSREPGRERAPALVRGDAKFLAAVQRDAGPHLAQPRSWAELERGLAGHGLSIRVHNGGFVFTDGVRKVRASEVDRAASRSHLERSLGALGAYRARQALATRTLDERAGRVEHGPKTPEPQAPPVAPATAAAVPQREAEPATPPQVAPTAAPLNERAAHVEHAPTAAEQVPRAAAPRPVEVQLRTPAPAPAAPKAPAPAAVSRPQPAPRLEWWQVALHRVADVIRAARLSDPEARSLDDIVEAGYHRAPQEAKRLRDLHQRALDDATRLRGPLAKVYTDAGDAARRLRRHEREHDIEQTLAALQATPEKFGTLQTTWFGRTAAARARLSEVVEPLQTAIRSGREFPSRAELEAAEQRAAEGIKAGIAAREAKRALLIRAAQYERDAADLLGPLLRAEASPQWIAEQLGRLLPPEDREAAQMVERVLRAALTRSREQRYGIDLF
ncbi:MAG: relaxase/mobilization nuclease domain-containing protein [Longimicrobiaceae bacterium]